MSSLETLPLDALHLILRELPLDQRYHCTTICKDLLTCREELRLGLSSEILTALVARDYSELLLHALSSDKFAQGEWALSFCRKKSPVHVTALEGEETIIRRYLALLEANGFILTPKKNLFLFTHQEQIIVLSLAPCPFASRVMKGVFFSELSGKVAKGTEHYFTVVTGPIGITGPIGPIGTVSVVRPTTSIHRSKGFLHTFGPYSPIEELLIPLLASSD